MKKQLAASILALIGLIAGSIMTASIATAQEAATPEGEDSSSHPAHIHSGTCEELGDVVHPLEDATGERIDGTPEASPVPDDEGLPGNVIAHSRSTVEASLDDLLSEDHAVNVHQSQDAMDVFIACATIEGEATDGELILQLDELNDSGISGQVILSQTDDSTLEVTITLVDASADDFEETAEATPAD